MSLYGRLLQLESEPRPGIGVDLGRSAIAEYSRGRYGTVGSTAARAILDRVIAHSSRGSDGIGVGLNAEEWTDVDALVQSAQTGSVADRATRWMTIDDILMQAGVRAPGYSTEAEVRARLAGTVFTG
jgi:hypothetical protein